MDDFAKDFTKFIDSAIDKTKELGEKAKLYTLIKAEEAKKQEQYYRLGRKYYELFKDSPERDLMVYIEKLTACDEKIASLREELKKEDDAAEYREVEPKEETVPEAENETEAE